MAFSSFLSSFRAKEGRTKKGARELSNQWILIYIILKGGRQHGRALTGEQGQDGQPSSGLSQKTKKCFFFQAVSQCQLN
jgi:hypothetical protein